MDRESFELKRQWAKASIKEYRERKRKYEDQINQLKWRLDWVNTSIESFEKILQEEYKEKDNEG